MKAQNNRTLNELAPQMTRKLDESTIEKVTMDSLSIVQPLAWDQVPFNRFEYPSENLQREFYLDEKNDVWKLKIKEPEITAQEPTVAFTQSYTDRNEALQKMYAYITARENVSHISRGSVSFRERLSGLNQQTFKGLF